MNQTEKTALGGKSLPGPVGVMVLGGATVLVVVIAILSYRDSASFLDLNRQLELSQQILSADTELLSAVKDAETGQRGFLLTGRETYLEPYNLAISRVSKILDTLASLTELRPDVARRVESLKPLVHGKMEELGETIRLDRSDARDAALAVVLSDRGKRVMDQIREICAQIESTTRMGMTLQAEATRSTASRTQIVSTAGSFLIFVMLAAATVTIQRGNRRREALFEALSEREQALRSSQQLIAAVIDNSTALISVKDLTGHYVLANRQIEKILHRDRKELAGKTDHDLFPMEQADAVRAADQRVAMSGTAVEGEQTVALEDGPHTYLAVRFPIHDAYGKITAIGTVSTDITERKRAESLRVLLAGIVESSGDAIVSETLDGIVTSWNTGAEKTFGYAAAEMIGEPASRLVPLASGAVEGDIVAHLREGKSVGYFETSRVRKDGMQIEVSVTVSPLKDLSGAIVGVSNIMRDISERKRAEKKQQAQLERLQLLDHITRAIGQRQDLKSIFQVTIGSLENSLTIDFGCICLIDPVGRLMVTCIGARSQAVAAQLQMTEQTEIEVDRNGLARCVGGRLVHEPDIRGVAFPFPRRLADGGLCSLVLAPLLTESRVFGVVVAARRRPGDFSSTDCEFLRQLSEHVALAAHQAQIYDALQQAYDDLRQTQQAVMQQDRLHALGQMASGIAHDINNALSPVALYTESLLEREPNLSERARKTLEITQRALGDVAQTVGRMQEFYRPRERPSILKPVDLNALVPQVLELTRARWSDMPQQRGMVIQVRPILADDLPHVPAIEGEIREALVNLILNAVDAMPDGGTLTLRTSRARAASSPWQHVHVEVQDTGTGMSEETRRRCLEPFYSTKGERGTGLGLAMVFGAMQRHNAEIDITSALGKGTTVLLRFPVPVATSGETATDAVKPGVPRHARILIIDDDPMILRSMRETLEGEGHDVVTATGGQEGIDSFQAALDSHPFDVVITDLGMPRIDGQRVAAAVGGLSPSTPVILLTGWGQRLVSEGAAPPCVARVLAKPPKLHELRSTLLELLPG